MGTYINIMGAYREITCNCGKKCNKINNLEPDCKVCDSCEECCNCNKKEELVVTNWRRIINFQEKHKIYWIFLR